MSDSLDSKSPKKHAVSSRCVDMLRTVLLILMLMALLVWSLTGGLKNWYPKKAENSQQFSGMLSEELGSFSGVWMPAFMHPAQFDCYDVLIMTNLTTPLMLFCRSAAGSVTFFHPEAFDFAGCWSIFQKLGGKRWETSLRQQDAFCFCCASSKLNFPKISLKMVWP